MGVGVSSLGDQRDGFNGGCSRCPCRCRCRRRRCPPLEITSLGDLPESCVSDILMYMDPVEICKLAKLNRAFRDASSADFVWRTKLPANYEFLARKVFNGGLENMNMKEIYSMLCQPNCFDDGTKKVWLDKRSGKMCLSISAKALRITGIEDRRYWNHIPSKESRFNTVAYLQQIWWVEVNGDLEFEYPPGSYSLYFKVQLGKTSMKRYGQTTCNIDQVHGWDMKPVRFQLSTSDSQQALSQCYLNKVVGKWVYYHVGDFMVDNVNTIIKIKFSMLQIDCTHTKGGLSLDSVFICPTEFKGRLEKL